MSDPLYLTAWYFVLDSLVAEREVRATEDEADHGRRRHDSGHFIPLPRLARDIDEEREDREEHHAEVHGGTGQESHA